MVVSARQGSMSFSIQISSHWASVTLALAGGQDRGRGKPSDGAETIGRRVIRREFDMMTAPFLYFPRRGRGEAVK